MRLKREGVGTSFLLSAKLGSTCSKQHAQAKVQAPCSAALHTSLSRRPRAFLSLLHVNRHPFPSSQKLPRVSSCLQVADLRINYVERGGKDPGPALRTPTSGEQGVEPRA